jgi:hypothetical protein
MRTPEKRKRACELHALAQSTPHADEGLVYVLRAMELEAEASRHRRHQVLKAKIRNPPATALPLRSRLERRMGVFKSLRRRKWKAAVNGEFRKRHGVDLRTVSEVIGPTTMQYLLNDEYELAPKNPVAGAENVTQMLDHVYRVNIASLATRDFALQIRRPVLF